MHRRALLATVGSLALASCGGRRDSRFEPHNTDPVTPPPNVTVYDEAKPMPEIPDGPTAEEAREFVATHEENLVYNELIGEADAAVRVAGYGYPTSVSVEPATTQVVREDDAGVYLLSSCSGRAEYYCEDRDSNGTCGKSAGRNAHAVTHYVGHEHVRIPYNWYACKEADEPHASDDPAENVDLGERERGARFNLYDFTGWQPTVEVTIRHKQSGDVVLEGSYDLELPLTIQPDVTRRRGTYEIEVDVAGANASGEWEVTSKDDPSWRGLCIYLTPIGEPAVLTVGTGGPIELDDVACRVLPTTE